LLTVYYVTVYVVTLDNHLLCYLVSEIRKRDKKLVLLQKKVRGRSSRNFQTWL